MEVRFLEAQPYPEQIPYQSHHACVKKQNGLIAFYETHTTLHTNTHKPPSPPLSLTRYDSRTIARPKGPRDNGGGGFFRYVPPWV